MTINLQELMDLVSKETKKVRSKYHLTLGKLIAYLEAMPDKDAPVLFDFGGCPTSPHSYRGYYEDLAFERKPDEQADVKSFLGMCMYCLDTPFTGYKGGEFVMGPDTPLWFSAYGSAYEVAITGVQYDERDNIVTLVTKDLSL